MWAFERAISSCPEDEPTTGMCGDHSPYCSFVNTLDCVAERHTEVYRVVYEHIQCRTKFLMRGLQSIVSARTTNALANFKS